jgi:hypothetical protein
MSPATIPTRLRRRIAAQAGHRCGYRRTSERLTGIRLTVDHIVPLAAGGATEEHNLWLACRACNEFKGTRTRAQDPDTGDAVELFNPRQQVWREHFAWSEDGTLIVGLTPVGRATVAALRLNRDLVVYARRRWVKVGWRPPEEEAP